MGIWMYHKLTDSVYPVPTTSVDGAATLAEKLPHRIYFEAELTTAPAVVDVWVLQKGDGSGVYRYDEEYLWRAHADMRDGDVLYKIERRSEMFTTEETRDAQGRDPIDYGDGEGGDQQAD